jgi:hypothetical protein
MSDPKDKGGTLLGPNELLLFDPSGILALSSKTVELRDPDTGLTRAVLGSTELENTKTGAVTTQPVSSLTLFDKEGKVLFRAP